MCFDRNINGNRDIKIFGLWLIACARVHETHFNIPNLADLLPFFGYFGRVFFFFCSLPKVEESVRFLISWISEKITASAVKDRADANTKLKTETAVKSVGISDCSEAVAKSGNWPPPFSPGTIPPKNMERTLKI